MAALVVYEESLCECGQPFDASRDPLATFLIEDQVCQACWAREYREAQLREASGEKDAKVSPLAGTKVWVLGQKPTSRLRGVPRGE